MERYLTESGIRIPKNSKSAKVLCHSDMDGICSGILAINQLQKQGIPKNRITIEFVQYGDMDLLDKATRKNKAQAVVAVDFAAFPRINMESAFSKLSKTTGSRAEGYKPKYNMKFSDFKRDMIDKNVTPTFSNLSGYLKKNVGDKADFFTNRKKLRQDIDNFLKAWKSLKPGDDPEKVNVTDIDYVSDHHSNDKGDLVGGKSGTIGRTKFKSDTEHLATVAAQGFMAWNDIKEITKVDSAGYVDTENTFLMKKDFKGKGRKERLAIIINALLTSLLKSNKKLTADLMKNTAPSLISIYSNCLKYAKLNDIQLSIYSELKKAEPDYDKVEKLSTKLPRNISKNVYNSTKDKIKPTSSLDALRNKNLKSIAMNTDKKTTLFDFKGNIAVQKWNARNYPPRYLFAHLTKEGKNPLFVIKELPTMIQISVSPYIKPEDKDKIDLESICLGIIDKAEKNYGTASNKWMFDIIRKNTGGHKSAIYNISGLGAAGSAGLSSGERTALNKAKEFTKRRNNLSKEGKKKIGTKAGETKPLEASKKEFSDKIKSFIKNELIKEVSSAYSNLSAKKISNKYEVK